MDPLSILGLAAAIVQFIDFGTKLVRKTREITNTGSSVSVKDLDKITTDLANISLDLGQQLNVKSGRSRQLTKEEKVSDIISHDPPQE